VVLEAGDQDLVPGADILPPMRLRHQVDGFGGAPDEHDLTALRRAHEPLHPGPSFLVGVGREHRELVHAPVDVGVVALVDVALGVDHRLGFLGAGRAVEVDERLPVDGRLEHRELPADGLDVQDLGGAGGAGQSIHTTASLTRAAPCRCAWRCLSTALRRGSTGRSWTTSLAKA
jgi:hypothetical protein